MAYLAEVSVALVLCSGIFWGITCGSIAVLANFRNPLRHFVVGAFLQLLGFIIVGAIALFAKRRTVVIRQRLEDQKIVSNPVAPGDEW